MRIFYALTFNLDTQSKLIKYRDIIANNSLKGRFTRQDNFHLTLSFIGDVAEQDLEDYEDVLDSLPSDLITLKADHFDTFKKKNRDIVYLGLESHKTLTDLVKLLNHSLKEHNLIYDDRKYIPHITLGRQVLFDSGTPSFTLSPLEITPYSLALMVSHRVHDKLSYQPIKEVILTPYVQI